MVAMKVQVATGDFLVAPHKSALLASEGCVEAQLEEQAADLGIQLKPGTKDLGVALGEGKEVQKIKTVRRMRRIDRLTLQERWLAQFIGASALGAGVYGTAHAAFCQADLMQLRRWAAFGLYKGSKMARPELVLAVMGASRRADPAFAVAERVVRFAAQTVQAGLRTEEHWRMLAIHAGASGPFAALAQALEFCGIEWQDYGWTVEGQVLRQPLKAHKVQWASFLQLALSLRDQKILVKRCGESIGRVDWSEVRRGRAKLNLGRLGCKEEIFQEKNRASHEGALRSLQVGDLVVEQQARHWNGGDGACKACGVLETKQHRLWECETRSWQRFMLTGAHDCRKLRERLPEVSWAMGLPTILPEVAQWGREVPESEPGPRQLNATVVYTDASGFEGRDRQLRVVAWAAVWQQAGQQGWQVVQGTCRQGASVAQGELEAVLWVTRQVTPGQRIKCITDCGIVAKVFRKMATVGFVVQQGHRMAAQWEQLQRAVQERKVEVEWVPAHCTVEQFTTQGGKLEDWHGNNQADNMAKEAGLRIRAPQGLRERRKQQLSDEQQAREVVTAAHLQALAQRERVSGTDRAQKARKRKEPAIPRIAGGKRRCVMVQEREVQDELNMWQTEAVNVEGLCRLIPMMGPLGMAQHFAWTAAGNLRWCWRCVKCGTQAHDANRALALVQQVCKVEQQAVTVTKREHEVGVQGLCKWCGLDLQASRAAKCQAVRVMRAEQEDVAAGREVWKGLLRIQALRCIASGKWKAGMSRQQAQRAWLQPAAALCPSEAAVRQLQQQAASQPSVQGAAPSAGSAGLLKPYAGHWRVGHRAAPFGMFCLKCGSSPAKGHAHQRWPSEPCPGERELPRSYRGFLAELPEGQWAQWPPAWKAWRLRVV